MILGSREPRLPKRTREYYPSARAAFHDYLLRTDAPNRGAVLLPAYVGWSSREGSGVFDPIRATASRFRFYRVTRDLRVDVADLERHLHAGDVSVLVLIHYFGWPDPAAPALAALARSLGIPVIEDEAHAMLTDMIGAGSGRDGDAALFSLHKMLPVTEGGMLVWNGAPVGTPEVTGGRDSSTLDDFDLGRLAQSRRRNAELLRTLLAPLAGRVNPLWGITPPGVVPQTFPVTIHSVDRSALYHAMNAAGFGVVSLYHTMIDEISALEFPDSHWLAQRVMNLPIHPGATGETLTALVQQLDERTRV